MARTLEIVDDGEQANCRELMAEAGLASRQTILIGRRGLDYCIVGSVPSAELLRVVDLILHYDICGL